MKILDKNLLKAKKQQIHTKTERDLNIQKKMSQKMKLKNYYFFINVMIKRLYVKLKVNYLMI